MIGVVATHIGSGMDAYLIVGEPNARKSSVLRALTGCANRSVRDIRLASGLDVEMYARVSSLQESKTTPAQFINEASTKGPQTVVFCLWPFANPLPAAKCPDADGYIAAFQRAGWNLIACAVLGHTTYRPTMQRVRHFPAATGDPINVTAAAVRSHFRWL